MKYIKKFENNAAYESWQSTSAYVTPNVVLCADNYDIHINKKINGFEYVDLGLPSGALWAKCNVGATTEEGYGGYYAWGETSEKSNYSWSTYAFGSSSPFSKYDYDDDGKTELESVNDAAAVNMGGDWHIPTQTQMIELTANTTTAWTAVNGVNGMRFTSTANGNSIFIPAAGLMSENEQKLAGDMSTSWTNALAADYVDEYSRKSILLMGNSNLVNLANMNRAIGLTVRGVIG